MKPLLPTLREKKRYIVFQIISKNAISDFSSVNKSIISTAKDYFGTLGMANSGLLVLQDKWSKEKQTGVIKTNNKFTDAIKSVFTLIKQIDGQDVIVQSVIATGMINKVDQYIK